MNKHTPGPWFAVADKGQTIIRTSRSSAAFSPLAIVKGDKRDTLKDQEANARLIAAAPDLLEALEALADSAPSACCVDFHHKPGDYHDADESCPALDRYEAACLSARAAIARARGER